MKPLPEIVVLDTCVLLSNVLRHVVLQLSGQGHFAVAWSPVIGDEWRRNASRLWRVSEETVWEQWAQLQRAFPVSDQGDVSAYKEGLHYSDRKDWHVIAAARAVQAQQAGQSVAILTRNLKDFNRSELRRLGVQLWDPDRFLAGCLLDHAGALKQALNELLGEKKAAGFEIESQPLSCMLKRERLFRLNRLIVAAENTQ